MDNNTTTNTTTNNNAPATDAPLQDTAPDNLTHSTSPQQQQQQTSPEVTMLKEAFPGTDIDVIEAILDSHQGDVERSFEDLLRVSDPNYRPEPQSSQDDDAPIMPPRPTQQQVSPEEQLRMDEEYAKQLALEDERQRVRQHQSRQQQQGQQQSGEGPMDEFIKDIQEELPIIKEKMIEAGNAAKKKVMDWYNQVKTNRMNNNDQGFNNNNNFGTGSSMPTSNAQYRGLPSDRDDDYLLSGDMSALHLSDHDVYAQTKAPAKNYYDYQGSDFDTNETTIHINNNHSSQKEAQILADEEFARQLAQDDEMWRQQQQQQQQDTSLTMPPRDAPIVNKQQSPRVIVSPRSPLEEYDEQDNKENVPLNAYSRSDSGKSDIKKEDDNNARSYVIGDYDDSDDGLVDLEDDDEEGMS
ncbi:hypothetical protein BC941DRAFT_460238 [Chlamydoabsidia padenii]|nr:hypothetical protein BC941DRAFT_460238 [Chlamydoabsidia padenii]